MRWRLRGTAPARSRQRCGPAHCLQSACVRSTLPACAQLGERILAVLECARQEILRLMETVRWPSRCALGRRVHALTNRARARCGAQDSFPRFKMSSDFREALRHGSASAPAVVRILT